MKNVNLPKSRVYVRCDAFGQSEKKFEPAWLISVRAIRGRPLCFQVWVDAYAACYDKVPPHCIYWYEPDNTQTNLPLNKIQLWECLSSSIEVWQKAQLTDVPMLVNIHTGEPPQKGKYWFTIDYLTELGNLGYIDVGDAEVFEEHKEANVIKLSNGQIAIYPNNRLKWLPPSLTSLKAKNNIPDWEVSTDEKWSDWWQSSTELLGDSKWIY
jgi:hypothetical protein